jgi:hypothetical protein
MANDKRESNDEAARLAARQLVAMNVTETRVASQWSQTELPADPG